MITFFVTHNYNLLKLCGWCSGHVQCIAKICAIDLQSSQVKLTFQDSINEFIIRKLNLLVVEW